MELIEQLTYSTVKISCKYQDGSTGCGTGFVVSLAENKIEHTHIPVIITNKHVIDKAIETSFEFCIKDDQGNPVDTQICPITINGIDLWIAHPNLSVDLCCLPIGFILSKNNKIYYKSISLDLFPNIREISQMSAMENLVMVGYPIGISDEFNHKPIIRRGITATHLKNNYQGKKEFLIDMPCYWGSSGSPIFAYKDGVIRQPDNQARLGIQFKFVGVLYAGQCLLQTGETKFFNLPNIQQKTFTRIPINLGIAIKSERILEFESILKLKMEKIKMKNEKH